MKFASKSIAMLFAGALLTFPGIAQKSASSAAISTASPVPTIVIHAKDFAFVPSEITLKKDQTVKLELTSDDVEHSLVVRELGINGLMKKGETTDVIVTPQQIGNFSGTCGKYCGIGHNKMHLIVHVIN